MSGLALMVVAIFGIACTDVGLYQSERVPFRADRLTVNGTVCTDDPRQQNFPVKVVFLVDTSQSLLAEKNDPTSFRGRAINTIVNRWAKLPNYSFAVVGFAASPFNFTDGFTRDIQRLSAAAGSLQSSSIGGGGTRRDLRAAVELASNLVTGDILASDAGVVARSAYVVVLFSGGASVPSLGRCACRPTLEVENKSWPGCPWSECDRVPGEVAAPPVADTYSFWTVPSDPQTYGIEGAKLPPGSLCQPICVYAAGGRPGSCEETQLVSAVKELSQFARDNGAASFQFHTTYLPDRATRAANEIWTPPPCLCSGGKDCSVEADHARATRLLSEMAFAGKGGFLSFAQGAAISFEHVDLFTQRDPLVIKEFLVSNANVIATNRGLTLDSDQDGLSDETEVDLGTCGLDPDTDGDGIGDAVEVRLASDPRAPDEVIECIDLVSTIRTDSDLCAPPGSADKTWKSFADRDGDGLNACEERLLGTDNTLLDSDADGFPDRIEFVAGTNFLVPDPREDPDDDGTLNRSELRQHTNPRASDAQEALDLGYDYVEFDEDLKTVISFSQPKKITGVRIRTTSAETRVGIGSLRFQPGPPPTLSWCDGADTNPAGVCDGYGSPVDISVASADGYQITSRNGESLRIAVDGPATYSPNDAREDIVISGSQRNCRRFRVRNIALRESKAAWFRGTNGTLQSTRGDNAVFLYLAETPVDAKDGFGIFKVASIVPNYLRGPPETRTPLEPETTVNDEDFSIFE